MIAEVTVLPPIPGREVLSYSVPGAIALRVREGSRVLVPLGARQVTGIVLAVADVPATRELKEIIDAPDAEPILGADLLALARFAASYYMASLGEVLATAMLAGLRAQSRRRVRRVGSVETAAPDGLGRLEGEILRRLANGRAISTGHLARSLRVGGVHDAIRSLASRGLVEILEEGARAPARERYRRVFLPDRMPPQDEEAALARRAPSQKRLLERIRAGGEQGAPIEELGGTRVASALRSLIARGWVRVEKREFYRSVVGAIEPAGPLSLTPAQAAALQAIEPAIRAPRFETFLLRGVTGSGKTAVYLQAAAEASSAGRGAILLVPEISLTEELVTTVVARFGASVALLHSALSPGERWDEWRRLARREARILVGARSAIFAPVPDLGLVIVDEEHDGAYKQDDGLRYNARDLAVVRARNASCPVILGSATPSVESYWNARSGRYQILELPERIERRPLPKVELLDLRTERPTDTRTIFAPRLEDALVRNQAEGKQSLIFLNRRGFARYLQCARCGNVLECPNCSVTLTLHLRLRTLRCHHCDHRIPVPELCPDCRGPTLREVGVGTEQVEAALRRLLPQARIARMDRDTTVRKGSHRRILSAWRNEEIDVLVGTQMVTKGHDIPGVTLVGVIAADQSMNFPDFRAAERTFQMLTQVAGRAGRGAHPGLVFIQTFRPDHYALVFARTHDFPGFAEEELRHREALGYPPFARLVAVRFDGVDASKVETVARSLTAALQAGNDRLPAEQRAKILGPATAPLERLRGRHRWQLLLKGRRSKALQSLVRPIVESARQSARSTVRITIDVDPYAML